MGFYCGLDLGQSQDYSAVVIAEHQAPGYAVRYIHRWPLNTPYPRIVEEVSALLARPPLRGDSVLIVDHTGCGRPVLDMIRQAGISPVAVSLHGGDRVSHEGLDYRVPKRDLVGVVAVLLQQHRLQIAEGLPLTAILTHELLAFRVKIDPATAHDSYSAWREQDHDDLVLALALAVWWGEATARTALPADLSLAINTSFHRASPWQGPDHYPQLP
jgi:hypothetical protein